MLGRQQPTHAIGRGAPETKAVAVRAPLQKDARTTAWWTCLSGIAEQGANTFPRR